MTQRIQGWEKALKLVIEKHLRLPSQYGVSDCYIICDDAVAAISGERINDALVGGYSNEIGAAKLLRQNGFETVDDVFASRFDTIPVSMAQRGDVGIVENNGQLCGGVFTSLGFMARSDEKVIFLSITEVKTAYKVAR